ncbi:MAG: hypothetical protein AB7V43_10190 [Acidimicrobiia bacterium]
MNQLTVLHTAMQVLRSRWDNANSDDRGEITEKVIIVAIFAALAIAAGAIIVAKVTAKANAIPTE